MNDLPCNNKISTTEDTERGVEDVPCSQDSGTPRHSILDRLPVGSQSDPVSPGLSSGENTPSASQENFEHADGDTRVPLALNEDAKSSGIVCNVAPTLSMGANAVVPFNPDDEDDEDEDDDDDWFRSKGPQSGSENQISRPIKVVIKK
ncbi:hypothetical protein L227DRAFT_561691 [Lentinus tigrinus ALCF2SS1-6]|uniref:Uncharacterized protein n=1 Tax=Lentinus tigrinus ALCF2SS1-6 TaxID=1328759 RepID=A0A5C2SGN2_9APHY|nr:hypothetical protein L227DRAFT_561691 [Lentinus tigrinus ALCF2SS1-6]